MLFMLLQKCYFSYILYADSLAKSFKSWNFWVKKNIQHYFKKESQSLFPAKFNQGLLHFTRSSSTQQSLLYDRSDVMVKAQWFHLTLYSHTRTSLSNPSSLLAVCYRNVILPQCIGGIMCYLQCFKNTVYFVGCHDLHKTYFLNLKQQASEITYLFVYQNFISLF